MDKFDNTIKIDYDIYESLVYIIKYQNHQLLNMIKKK